MSKCDLHIHSRYSARSEEWLFRRFDFPDSYSDPKELHRQSLERGMNYVTITDHDTIDGCLQIIDLPHTFISEQVTTYFPQDPCKLHILVWGISQEQHGKIEGVRDNIFELQHYLQTAQIAHAVAHPLYSINGQLDASHLERLILLFKHFEGINGLRDALLSDLAQILLGQQRRRKSTCLQTAIIWRPRTLSRGKRFSSAARMITADNLPLRLLRKRRTRSLRQNFSNTFAA